MEEMKASIDVGANVTGALEKLATSLGTTVEKIYPLYTKQAVINGWCFVGASCFCAVVALIIAATVYKKTDFEYDSGWNVLFCLCCLALAVAFLLLVLGSGWCSSHILNPEYWATKELIEGLAKLTGK